MNKEFWLNTQVDFVRKSSECYFCDASLNFKEKWKESPKFCEECRALAEQFVRENNIKVDDLLSEDELFCIEWNQATPFIDWSNKMREIRLNFLNWIINKSE